ncbi:MAG: 3-isopropylmalate dehydratase [Candidatus Bathyarchaeia archaeon]
MLRVEGKAIRLGDHINTDFIISGKYKFKTQDIGTLAKHAFEDLDPTFVSRINPGDILVAGVNFGCGSSREHAPRVIKAVGIGAVAAKSFARIFFRNCINVGLPAVVLPGAFIDATQEGDLLKIELEGGVVNNFTRGLRVEFGGLPKSLAKLMMEGGVVEYVKKYGSLPWI